MLSQSPWKTPVILVRPPIYFRDHLRKRRINESRRSCHEGSEGFSNNAEEESEKEEEDGDPKKRTELSLFLWSVENLQISKVSLSEPPDNNVFYSLAQKTMRSLNKEGRDLHQGKSQKERKAHQRRTSAPKESVANRLPQELVAERQQKCLAK